MWKKIFFAILLFLIVYLGNTTIKSANTKIPISVFVNDRQLKFDVAPANINGRVMVPFRTVAEALGAKVDWQPKANTVWLFLEGNYVGLSVGSTKMTTGNFEETDKIVSLDIAPRLIEGRVFVPIRAISEGLQAKVNWDGGNNKITIQSNLPTNIKIDTKEKFLNAIEKNINDMNKSFYIDTSNLSEDLINLNICDLYRTASKFTVKWWNYTVDNKANAYVHYQVTYSMAASVTKAFNLKTTSGLSAKELEVYQKVEEIIRKNITSKMNDYEKEIIIHDYIVINCAYDKSQNPSDDTQTPYGTLVNRLAVCNGYTETFAIFMNVLGIKCDIIYGTALADGIENPHSWNRVLLDNEYYLVDVTWDDPTPDKPGVVNYQYFNVTDQLMNLIHTPEKRSDVKSIGKKYNYYVYNGLIAQNEVDAKNLIKKAYDMGQRSISFRGENLDVSKLDLSQLLIGFSSERLTIQSSINKNFNIITIRFT